MTSAIQYPQDKNMTAENNNLIKFGHINKVLIGSSLLAALSLMTACSSSPARQQPVYVKSVPAYHIVRSGESLSRIAVRYGLDYRRIAALNGLDGNYTIYPGQRLRLTTGTTTTTTTRPVATRPSQPVYRQPVTRQPTYQTTTPTRVTTQPVVVANNGQSWRRPVNGNLIRLFNANANIMGNWYSAAPNTPVVATQAGTVMYVGSDLPEYGKLVMIQHNKDFISAYAHLGSFNVQERQTVTAGQAIGTVGNLPGNNQPVVEFQIRYRGTPVNPATYVK